jgi:hypothetical protein
MSYGSTGIWSQDLTLTMQPLYHSSHISSPFLLRLFLK